MNIDELIEDNAMDKKDLLLWIVCVQGIRPLAWHPQHGFDHELQAVHVVRAISFGEFAESSAPDIWNTNTCKEPKIRTASRIITGIDAGIEREEEYRLEVSILNRMTGLKLDFDILSPQRSYDALINDWYARIKEQVGPVRAVVFQGAKNYERTWNARLQNDRYLPYMYKDKVLFLHWTRGEQTGAVARKLFAEEPTIESCYLYGACGMMHPDARKHDIQIPECVRMDSNSIEFRNALADIRRPQTGQVHQQGILNVRSVVSETKTMLRQALSEGYVGVEMELHGLVKAIKDSGREIKLGAVYYCSDTPLTGVNVANTPMDSPLVEYFVDVITERVKTD